MAMRRNSGRVERSDEAIGVAEDPDFDERFRRKRIRRWMAGMRNGIDPISLLGFRLGLSENIRFHGVTVEQSDNQATYRLIEDIWMRGEYDIPSFSPMRGWRVIDIGANVGIYAMLAASRGASVIAYEPAPDTFQRLIANTRLWGIECHNTAVVGAARDSVLLYLHPLRDTRNTLLGERGGVSNTAREVGPQEFVSYAESVRVSAVPIATVLAEPCDLLKIACEGAEFEIVAHARAVMRNAARIVVELHSEMQTTYGGAAELCELIRSAGFTVEGREPYPGTSRRFLTASRNARP